MSVMLRLTRAGAKGAPYYHVVATDKRNKRDGAYIEQLGSYDPKKNPAEILLNQERIDYWLKVGARPSETVASLIKKSKASATPATP
jgi:small subunit ribosomal protein S16